MAGEQSSSIEAFASKKFPIISALEGVDPARFGFDRQGVTLTSIDRNDPSVPRDPANPLFPRRWETDYEVWGKVFSRETLRPAPDQPEQITKEFRNAVLAFSHAGRISPAPLPSDAKDAFLNIAETAGHRVRFEKNPAAGLIEAVYHANVFANVGYASENNFKSWLEIVEKVVGGQDDSKPSEFAIAEIFRNFEVVKRVFNHITDPRLLFELKDQAHGGARAGTPDDPAISPKEYIMMNLITPLQNGQAIPELGLGVISPEKRALAEEQIWLAMQVFYGYGFNAYYDRAKIVQDAPGQFHLEYYGSDDNLSKPNIGKTWRVFDPLQSPVYPGDLLSVQKRFSGTKLASELKKLDFKQRPYGWKVANRLEGLKETGLGGGLTVSDLIIHQTTGDDRNPAGNNDPEYASRAKAADSWRGIKKAGLIVDGIYTAMGDPAKGLLEAIGAGMGLYKVIGDNEQAVRKTKDLREKNLPPIINILGLAMEATLRGVKKEDLRRLFDVILPGEFNVMIDGHTDGMIFARNVKANHFSSLLAEPGKGGTTWDYVTGVLKKFAS